MELGLSFQLGFFLSLKSLIVVTEEQSRRDISEEFGNIPFVQHMLSC